MPYDNIIRYAFNSIIQRASDVPGVSKLEIWQEVRDIIFTLNLDYLERDQLFIFLIRIAPLFVRRDCQDRGLMVRMFYLVRRQRGAIYPYLTYSFMKQRFYGIIRTLDEHARHHSPINDDFSEIFSMPYKEAQVYDEMGDSVTYTAVAGDIILLKLLLKFGATMIQPPEENSHWWYCEEVVQKLLSYIPEQYIRTSLSSNFSQTSERRLFFIILCLEVLIHLKSHQSDSCNYILSLQLLFKAIPEPLVTSKEIFNCLEKLLRGPKKDEEIQTVVNEFGIFSSRESPNSWSTDPQAPEPLSNQGEP